LTARLASQPKRPPRRLGHISGLIGGLDEISGRFLDQIRRVIYLVEKLHDEIVNPQNPFGPVKFGAFLVSNDQLTELHGDDGSSMRGDVPANSLSETWFSRHRHMAGSHTQMAYSMPFWAPIRLTMMPGLPQFLRHSQAGHAPDFARLQIDVSRHPICNGAGASRIRALKLRLVESVIWEIGPTRAAITHGRSGADQVAHWWLLIRWSHAHVDRLSAEPRRQEFLENCFEVVDHGKPTHAASPGSMDNESQGVGSIYAAQTPEPLRDHAEIFYPSGLNFRSVLI
jgi:hypothetical protein